MANVRRHSDWPCLIPALPGSRTKNLFVRDRKGQHHFLVVVSDHMEVDLGPPSGSYVLSSIVPPLLRIGIGPMLVLKTSFINRTLHGNIQSAEQ